MRGVWLAAVVLAALGGSGCHISRRIVEREPIRSPRLETLERHLTYVDPDSGKPDYVIEVGR
ncbi:MAG: hypothetical protein GXY85_06995 [Candidatus Brocadiaceae bacterium]|nr:hypothetical protein [Candidatus Brocadiaceae bacterium]